MHDAWVIVKGLVYGGYPTLTQHKSPVHGIKISYMLQEVNRDCALEIIMYVTTEIEISKSWENERYNNVIGRYVCIIVKGDEMLYNPNGRAYGINLQSIEKHLKFCNNKLHCIV